MFEELVKKYPKLSFLNRPQFQGLPVENQQYLKELIDDAIFWIELEEKEHASDGFKFLAAAYGLDNAHKEAKNKKLAGKEKEKHIRPHQDLYTMFNPYSGNGHETDKKTK